MQLGKDGNSLYCLRKLWNMLAFPMAEIEAPQFESNVQSAKLEH
jgi:hypothetical protein